MTFSQESIQPILDWISAHPTWSGFIVFLISLSESLAIVGLVVPGVVMMTAIGTMMGSGILPFWQTLWWAILGAIAGDGVSYWLGYHYHEHLRDFWPFKQFPNLLARGETFFKNHGGKSIIFGRFVGPVRPMIPVIAGMMDMTPRRFLFFNVLSAFAWAPIYSLPGILIGASLGNLSPEVASRVGLLILLLLLALWLLYEFLLTIGAWIFHAIERGLTRTWETWQRSKKFPTLHNLFKTAQGTEAAQLGIGLLFLFSLILFVFTCYGVHVSDSIVKLNEPVYQVLRALYWSKLVDVFALITMLGEPWVLLPAVFVCGVFLFFKGRIKTLCCWYLTIGTGFALGTVVKFMMNIPRPETIAHYLPDRSFPSGHALTSTLVFGLTAALIQSDLPSRFRSIPWISAILLIFTICFSRVYLGFHWFTDIMGGITLGMACVSLGFFLYRRFEAKSLPMGMLLIPGISMIIIGTALYATFVYPKQRIALIRHWFTTTLNTEAWWQDKETNTLTLYRTGAFKRQATEFDVQWLGTLPSLKSLLEKAGFEPLPPLTFGSGVLLLEKEPNPIAFPIMPKFHRDRLPVLVMAKAMSKTKRLVLQLWRSDFETPKHIPLWVGTIRLEEAKSPLPLITVYIDIDETMEDKTEALQGFIQMLSPVLKSSFKIVNSVDNTQHKILLLDSSKAK